MNVTLGSQGLIESYRRRPCCAQQGRSIRSCVRSRSAEGVCDRTGCAGGWGIGDNESTTERRWGRPGAATQRSTGVSHGPRRITKSAARSPYRRVEDAPCRLWHARGLELNRLDRYGVVPRSWGCETLLYDVLKAGLRAAACGGRPRPPQTRRSGLTHARHRQSITPPI
jgi:hypothetical protein